MQDVPPPFVQDHGEIIPELNELYPIDYWRLLRWTFVSPQTIVRYRAQYGNESLHVIGCWLTTGFIWLPLLFPIVGYFSNRVPLSSTVATIFIVALPTSAWFIYTRQDLLGAALGAIFYIIHVIDKSAADGDVRVALVANVAIATALVFPMIISLAATSSLAMPPFVVLSLGVGSWVAIHVGGDGFVRGFLIGAVICLPFLPIVASLTYALQRRFVAGKRFRLMPMSVVVSIVANAVLCWVYLLGGWDVLVK
jgi:hypothetical protein